MFTTDEMMNKPHYAAATQDGWGIEMVGIFADDGSDTDYAGTIGMPITNFTIAAPGIKKARVRNRRGRWLEYSDSFDTVNGLGDGTDITGIEIVGQGYVVGAHVKGGSWLGSVMTSDEEGAVVIGIGTPIDAIWIDTI